MTAAAGALLPLGGDAIVRLTSGPSPAFEDMLTTVAGAALVPALTWLWITTTWTVADVLRGDEIRPSAGLTRRLVLVACGIATVAASPAAQAADQPAPPAASSVVRPVLTGLPLPDRASDGDTTPRAQGLREGRSASGATSTPARRPLPVALQHRRAASGADRQAPPTRTETSATTADQYVVAPGDSLWRIAVDHLPEGAADAEVDAFWRDMAAANRGRIGADPNVIQPGLVLDLAAPGSPR